MIKNNFKSFTIYDFSPHLFWDIDKDEIELEKNIHFIVKKTLIYGFYKDWQIIFKLYGKDVVCGHAKKIRELDKKTASFISTIADIPITEFACYTTTQLNPKHWNF